MKAKLLYCIMAALILTFTAAAQDLKAIQDDYTNQMKTTTYGNDPKVGKYADIRGFNVL
jgi:hypothetical protein